MNKSIIIGIVIFVIILIILMMSSSSTTSTVPSVVPAVAPSSVPASPSSVPVVPAVKSVIPRPTFTADCGYGGTRGWYDIQNQGVANDYCRAVGDTWFLACKLAGSTDEYTIPAKGVSMVSKLGENEIKFGKTDSVNTYCPMI